MNSTQLIKAGDVIARGLTYKPFEVLPFDGSKRDFLELTSYLLEYYGGSLGLSYLLKNNETVCDLVESDVADIVLRMSRNRILGVDTLFEFFGRFTQVPLEQFAFLSELDLDYKSIYSVRYFANRDIAMAFNEDALTPLESKLRICANSGVTPDVIEKLRNVKSLKR